MHSKLFYLKIMLLRYIFFWRLKHVSLQEKITLSFSIPFSLITGLIFRRKVIPYFGHWFYYDDITLPITLITYPDEVASHVLSQIDPNFKVKTVLDIGGNIGQFAVTTAALSDAQTIDVFEPNPEIFNLLEKNSEMYPEIKRYKYGVGKPGTFAFFFRKNKSATGSIIKGNSDKKIDEGIEEISIDVIDNIKNHTKRNSYDLVKIDVEGSELEVLKNMQGIKIKYLYIEISADRDKPYSTSEIYSLIGQQFGKFEVVYQDRLEKGTPCFNVLLYFV